MKKFKEKLLEKAKQYWMPLILIFISFIFVSCAHKEKKPLKNNFIEHKDNIKKDSIISSRFYGKRNGSICEDFSLKNKNVLYFLNHFQEITPYEWNQCYGNFECSVKGEIIYDNCKYNYELNAGGWIHLSGKMGERFLGSKTPKDTVYFISIYYCDKSWD